MKGAMCASKKKQTGSDKCASAVEIYSVCGTEDLFQHVMMHTIHRFPSFVHDHVFRCVNLSFGIFTTIIIVNMIEAWCSSLLGT